MVKQRSTTAEKIGAEFIAGMEQLVATAKAGGLAAVKAKHGITRPASVVLGLPAVWAEDVLAARKALGVRGSKRGLRLEIGKGVVGLLGSVGPRQLGLAELPPRLRVLASQKLREVQHREHPLLGERLQNPIQRLARRLDQPGSCRSGCRRRCRMRCAAFFR